LSGGNLDLLEGDLFTVKPIQGLVDDTHTAGPKFFLQLIPVIDSLTHMAVAITFIPASEIPLQLMGIVLFVMNGNLSVSE
jgi:hypothetical protein